MDNLTLDADSLFTIADVIEGYCAKQSETINVYYAQIMALEPEWRDDETFGEVAEEIRTLKNKVLSILKEIHSTYPQYFRSKAQQILERPVMNTESSGPIKDIKGLGVPSNNDYTTYGQTYTGRSGGISSQGELIKSKGTSGSQPNTTSSRTTNTSHMPMGTTPNSFTKTRQEWHQDDPFIKIFNSPKKTGSYLNCHQGVPERIGGEGIEGFEGTCGLVCCENILRMAGVIITEAEIVNYAKSYSQGNRPLCTINSTPEKNGGTYVQDRQEILKHYGIDSKIEYTTDLEKIANYVTEGRGVILSVDSCMLWYETVSAAPDKHAITITSVERDAISNEITAFYICDSGSRNDDSSRRVNADILYEAMKPTGGELNVTNTIIR